MKGSESWRENNLIMTTRSNEKLLCFLLVYALTADDDVAIKSANESFFSEILNWHLFALNDVKWKRQL